MCRNPEAFAELMIASRTEARCKAIKADIEARPWFAVKGVSTKITTAQIDAMDTPRLVALIREYKPDLVMNIALPYQDLAIMDACLEAGVSYLDTANYGILPGTVPVQVSYNVPEPTSGLLILLGLASLALKRKAV